MSLRTMYFVSIYYIAQAQLVATDYLDEKRYLPRTSRHLKERPTPVLYAKRPFLYTKRNSNINIRPILKS